MNKTLEEILKMNKLIKSVINEADVEGLQKALEEKNQLIKQYNKDNKEIRDAELMKKINQLDQENMRNLDVLMHQTKDKIQKVKYEKGQVKNKNTKVKKYKTVQGNSGYRFDRKK
jgi:histidinol dehydrogenase